MNIESFNAGMAGLDSMRDAILEQKMRKKKDEQQALENRLRAEMIAYQKQRDTLGDTRYEDQTKYGRGRDMVFDTRYNDETGYRRQRDTLGDTRYEDQTKYGRGRDASGDVRYNAERAYQQQRDTIGDTRASNAFDLQKMQIAAQMAANGRKDDVTVRGYGDNGESYSYRVPKKQFQGGGMGDQSTGQPKMSREQLIEGVKNGTYTKDKAKQIARQMGWN